jgi:hypothetical protein
MRFTGSCLPMHKFNSRKSVAKRLIKRCGKIRPLKYKVDYVRATRPTPSASSRGDVLNTTPNTP